MPPRPWDIIGYLVDRLADEDKNNEARGFWQEVKAEAATRDKDHPRQLALYRDASRRLIHALRALPARERERREQALYDSLIEPFGPHLDPGEFEQIRSRLKTALMSLARDLKVRPSAGPLEARWRR